MFSGIICPTVLVARASHLAPGTFWSMKRLTGFSITAVLTAAVAVGLSSCAGSATVAPGDSGPVRATVAPGTDPATTTTDSTLPLLPPASIIQDPATTGQAATTAPAPAPATTAKPKAPPTTPKPTTPASTTPPESSTPATAANNDAAFSQIFGNVQSAVQAWYNTGDISALNQALTRAQNNFSHLGAKINISYGGNDPVYKVVLSGESRCMVEDASGPSLVLRPTSC